MPVPIVVVQGAQFGSEAKGVIAAWLCRERNIHWAVRTGSVNAGHTVIYNDEPIKMQQLPTGWVNPTTRLVLGAGTYIHPDILHREIETINRLMPEAGDVRDRLFIDYRCGVHLPEHEGRAKEANRHHRIGATGKGCSETILDKIRNRNNGYRLFKELYDWSGEAALKFVDAARLLNDAYDCGASILIEGTQGTFLDLHLGPYPFTTSRMTSAANWVAECGLSPALAYEVVLVARTFPIRVAGNSGPMSNEIDWTELAAEINAKLGAAGLPPRVHPKALLNWEMALRQAGAEAVGGMRYTLPTHPSDAANNVNVGGWTVKDRSKHRVGASELHRDALTILLEEKQWTASEDAAEGRWTHSELCRLFEMTTVTRKLRRIARMDYVQLGEAVMLNRPSWLALTFMNYLEPALWGAEPVSGKGMDGAALDRTMAYIATLERAVGARVGVFNTGPLMEHVVEVDKL